MKLKLCTIALGLFFISCSNDKKVTETSRQESTLKSDILLQSTVNKPFSRPNRNDRISLTLSGKTILESTATFKAVTEKGEEIHCETFSSKKLIQSDYRTANPALQEAHIRNVVKGYFTEDKIKLTKSSNTYAGL